MANETVVQVLARLRARGETFSTAESCTGGMLGQQITDLPGSSAVYPGGVISYCDAVKHQLLGVEEQTLRTPGAVSEPVARQMAEGARRVFGTTYALSATGIAGPDGDGSGKPVGLVYIALAAPDGTAVRELHLTGDRAQVRAQAAQAAYAMLLQRL